MFVLLLFLDVLGAGRILSILSSIMEGLIYRVIKINSCKSGTCLEI